MAEENNAETTANSATPKGTAFALQRIYLKDMSYESPLGAALFPKQNQPQISQDLNTSAKKVGDDQYEVVLRLTINATAEEKTAFLVEVQQAGLFQIGGLEKAQLAQVVNTVCAQILFPYAREAVDSAVIKGGFPALNLPPINFDALFAQATKESRARAEQEATTNSAGS